MWGIHAIMPFLMASVTYALEIVTAIVIAMVICDAQREMEEMVTMKWKMFLDACGGMEARISKMMTMTFVS